MTSEVDRLVAKMTTAYAGGIGCRLTPDDCRVFAKTLSAITESERDRVKVQMEITAHRNRLEVFEVWEAVTFRCAVYSLSAAAFTMMVRLILGGWQ